MLDKIKKLRDQTGISISACKKALIEADGDMNKAIENLQKQGISVANKKSERETKAGVVDAYIHSNKKIGSLVEVRSETDFVARNEEFKKFSHDVAMHIAATSLGNGINDLLSQPFIKNPNITIKDYLNETIQKFGENIEITRFEKFEI